MNMDWSLCEALATTNVGEISQVLHIYDINCQYQKHLRDRVQASPFLSIPEHIKLVHAIGLFHVHGHKEKCLYHWATSYVPGAGVIDGEVMETLWSVLNSVSASTRTASLAHRTEILDDHMNDNNWKKMLHIGISLNLVRTSYIDAYPVKSVTRRYNRALESALDARIALQRLSDAAPPAALDEWDASILEAELRREVDVSAMDVMHSKIRSGQTLKEIITAIMREDGLSISEVADNGDITEWLSEGFDIEDEQSAFILSLFMYADLIKDLAPPRRAKCRAVSIL